MTKKTKGEFHLVVRAGKLPHGLLSQTTYAPGEPVVMTIDLSGVPRTRWCEAVGDNLISIRGAILARLLLEK